MNRSLVCKLMRFRRKIEQNGQKGNLCGIKSVPVQGTPSSGYDQVLPPPNLKQNPGISPRYEHRIASSPPQMQKYITERWKVEHCFKRTVSISNPIPKTLKNAVTDQENWGYFHLIFHFYKALINLFGAVDSVRNIPCFFPWKARFI